MSVSRETYAARLVPSASPQSVHPIEGARSDNMPTTTDGLHYLPTPKLRLRVSPTITGRANPRASVVDMLPAARRKLSEGHLVKVYVDRPGQTPKALPISNHSVDDICSHSPVVAAAIHALGIPRAHIGHLALPDGDEEAYVILFAWFNTINKYDDLVPFPILTKTPLCTYYEAIEIARKLHLPMLSNLQGRSNHIVKSPWFFQSDDIARAYTKYEYRHPIRDIFVSGIVGSWSLLSERNYGRMKALGKAYSELWNELVARGKVTGVEVC